MVLHYVRAVSTGIISAAGVVIGLAFWPLYFIAALIDRANGRGPQGKGRA